MIGNKIRELRKKHNLTLDELANNLNNRYPGKFLNGKMTKKSQGFHQSESLLIISTYL